MNHSRVSPPEINPAVSIQTFVEACAEWHSVDASRTGQSNFSKYFPDTSTKIFSKQEIFGEKFATAARLKT